MDFEFIPGQFEKLRVVKTFHFGPIQQDLRENTVIEFDGLTVRLGDKSHNAPQLAAACRAGWLTVVGSKSESPVLKTAGMQIRPAQSTGNVRGAAIVMESASEEERVVGTVGGTGAKREAALAAHNNATYNAAIEMPKVVVQAVDTMPVEVTYPGVGNTPSLATKYPTLQDDGAGQGGRMIRTAAKTEILMGDEGSGQASEGVSVAKITTANKQRIVLTDAAQVDAEISRLDDIPPPKATKIARATAEGVTVATVSPAVKRTVMTDVSSAAREISRLDNSPPPKAKFATVRAEEVQGEDIKASKGHSGDVAEAREGDDLTDLLPDAVSTGVPAPGIAGEGFQWDMTRHWRERVKIAVHKHGDDPSVIERICAVELDSVVKHIRSELARRK